MSHNNYTHNTSNNYQIEIVVDPSSGGGTGTTQMYDDNGTVYYKMDIFPNLASTPLFAGNFTIDGISPTYKWSYSANPYGLTNNLPQLPPHNYYTTQQIQKTLNGLNGQFFPLDNNPIYGPIEFNNSTYVNGGFTTSGQRATWSKIILKEVYTDDAGVEHTANGQLQFQTSDEQLWHAGGLPNPNTFSATNGLPTKIVAYVYMELNQNVPAGNETLNIDFDETPPTGGCTDNLADNYSPNAHFDDGSCTYPPPTYNVIIQDLGVVYSDNLTGYSDPPFASEVPSFDGFIQTTLDLNGLTVMPKNLQIGSGATPGTITLANSYLPGVLVNEVVEIDLFPRRQTVGTGNFMTQNGVQVEIMETAIAAFDFPITGGPDQQDTTTPLSFLGIGSAANLTAAGIFLENIDSDTGSLIGANTYVPVGTSGSYSSNTSLQPSWMPDTGFLDKDGNYPYTIAEWDAEKLECLQPDGSTFVVYNDGMWVEEVYSTNNNTMSNYPGLEWFPRKVKFFIELSFTMPSNDVYVTLNLRHDTNRLLNN